MALLVTWRFGVGRGGEELLVGSFEHLGLRPETERDAELLAGLQEGGVEQWQLWVVHCGEEMVQAVVAESGSYHKEGARCLDPGDGKRSHSNSYWQLMVYNIVW